MCVYIYTYTHRIITESLKVVGLSATLSIFSTLLFTSQIPHTELVLLSNQKTIFHIKRAKMEKGLRLLGSHPHRSPSLSYQPPERCVSLDLGYPSPPPCLFSDQERATKACDWNHHVSRQPLRCPQSEPDSLWLKGGKHHPVVSSVRAEAGPLLSEPQLPALRLAWPLN